MKLHSRWLAMFAAAALVSALGACASDPKAPNEANFTRAIDARLDKYPTNPSSSLCLDWVPTFPREVTDFYGVDTEALAYKPYIRAGLAIESTVYRTQVEFAGSKRYAIHRFSLSNVGKAGAQTSFCYASARVGKIINFTEPGDMFGQHLSQVRWMPKIVAVADWAKSDRVANALPAIKQGIANRPSQEETSTVSLTNTGWEALP